MDKLVCCEGCSYKAPSFGDKNKACSRWRICRRAYETRDAEIKRLISQSQRLTVSRVRMQSDRDRLAEELEHYNDAKEQGLLVVLPCKTGDVIYEPRSDRGFISSYRITNIRIYDNGYMVASWELIDGIYRNLNGFDISQLGKTVFLTRAEAQAVLDGGDAK